MSDLNGATVEVEKVEEAKKADKPGKKGSKRKVKASRFARLWNCAIEHGEKHAIAGKTESEEGDIDVTLAKFPASLSTEAYEMAAKESKISVNFPLGNRRLAGIQCKSGTVIFKGDAALEFLADVQDTGPTEDEDEGDE